MLCGFAALDACGGFCRTVFSSRFGFKTNGNGYMVNMFHFSHLFYVVDQALNVDFVCGLFDVGYSILVPFANFLFVCVSTCFEQHFSMEHSVTATKTTQQRLLIVRDGNEIDNCVSASAQYCFFSCSRNF